MVFTIEPRSILAEFPLSNSMEPLWGLERSNRPAPMTNRLLTKKAVKNPKHSKRRSDKRRTKSSPPKVALPLALELSKTTLRRALQQRSSFTACLSMAMPYNLMPVPRCRPKLTQRGTLTKEAPVTWATYNQGKFRSLIQLQGKPGSLPQLRGRFWLLYAPRMGQSQAKNSQP